MSRKRMVFHGIVLLCSVALWGMLGVGCGSSSRPVEVQLQAMSSCSGVLDNLRASALRDMNEKIDKAIESLRKLSENAKGASYCDDYLRGYGTPKQSASGGVGAPTTAPNAGAPSPSAPTDGGGSSSSSGGASQVSGTNNQVQGVDEADFIKNDQKFIYVVTKTSFLIIEAWPAAQARVIATFKLEGQPKKLFVYNDRAVIYSSIRAQSSGDSDATRWSRFYRNRNSECTYGYNCTFQGDGYPTLVTVLDITDRTQPRRIRQLKASGSYLNARRIGNAIFTVLTSPAIKFPRVTTSVSFNYCGSKEPEYIEQVIAQYEALRARNTRIIREAKVGDWLPIIEETLYKGDVATKSYKPLADCGGFYRASRTQGGQFTTVMSMHLRTSSPAQTVTVVSPPGAVYASGKALYMSVPQARDNRYGWYNGMESLDEVSTIHKFGLFPEKAEAYYAASGVVKGKVLNQFSMDEYKDHLRIATTTGRVPNPNVHSTLTVFAQQGDKLIQTGQVDGLGPKEDIRSVRFSGERGFIVTFKKTDPLFVLDLADPKAPKVMAELKIPGFSTYMQMMDDKHLMSIGYDADDQGSFAYFTGVMLQIFDVSDPKNPRRIHREIIGTRGSSSEALTNHLAFNYFAPKNLLAIPITICTSSSRTGRYGDNMEFSGLLVYDVTAKDGFKEHGRVAHAPEAGVTCGNWWTNANSQVKRSIIMDDYIFSVSGSKIKVNHLNELTKDLVSIPLD